MTMRLLKPFTDSTLSQKHLTHLNEVYKLIERSLNLLSYYRVISFRRNYMENVTLFGWKMVLLCANKTMLRALFKKYVTLYL